MAKNKQRDSRGTQKPPREPSFERTLPRDYSDARKIEKMADRRFREAEECVRSIRTKKPHYYQILDVDPTRRKRREAATLRTMQTVRELVGELCPDVEPRFYIVEEWAKLNATGLSSYDLLEETDYLSLAAAIWMLDRIREQGNWIRALELLPVDDGTLDDVAIPDLYDPCFGDEFLRAMVYVIQERNSDCVGLSAKGKNHGIQRTFMDDYTAAGKQHQNVPSRQRFEALLELIDRDTVRTAVSHLEEKLWEWVKRYFICRADTARRESAYAREYNAFADRTEKVTRECLQRVQEQRRRKTAGAAPRPRIPLAAPVPEDLLQPKQQEKEEPDPLQFVLKAAAEMERLNEANEKLVDEINALCFDSYFLCNSPRDSIEESLGAQAAEQISGFEPGDPYELCFALLYLVDTDSDLPWLYYPGTCVMRCAACRLPWHFEDYDREDDEFWPVQEEDGEASPVPRRAAVPKRRQAPELLDWYHLNYTPRRQGEGIVQQSNLAQVLYRLSGCILPRNEHRYDAAVTTLAQYGITGKKTVVPFLHSLSLLGECRHHYWDWRLAFSFEEDDSAGEEPQEESEDFSAEDARETIRRLKAEVDQLSRSFHEATRESRDLRRKLETQAENWKQDRQELQDFRELFFHQGEEEESSPQSGSTITFPYTTQKRTVVFGGHDTWLKAIRPMLPEVRFVLREVIPNADLIRHADVIWIQSNALAHNHYYKIIDVARTCHIQVRYFGYASAEKCAEQLVEEDRK